MPDLNARSLLPVALWRSCGFPPHSFLGGVLLWLVQRSTMTAHRWGSLYSWPDPGGLSSELTLNWPDFFHFVQLVTNVSHRCWCKRHQLFEHPPLRKHHVSLPRLCVQRERQVRLLQYRSGDNTEALIDARGRTPDPWTGMDVAVHASPSRSLRERATKPVVAARTM